jgi:hypothetical protein
MDKIDNKRRGRRLKKEVLVLLMQEDFHQAMETLCSLPGRRVINPLFSYLCSMDPQIRWRAIQAIGAVVPNIAREDMESARVIMRRMIWNLNDESGGIGWGMPEAMGEVMAQHEGLAREYVMILKSYIRTDGNFLEYEPLQRGVLWGLGRLAQERPELVKTVIPHVQPFLSSGDAVLRGLAVWTLGFLGGDQVGGVLRELESDDTEVTLFLNGTERTYRISELARKALDADV